MTETGKSWTFILAEDKESRGWWLKITDPEQLLEYHEKTDGARYEGVIRNRAEGRRLEDMTMEERIAATLEGNRNFLYEQAAVMIAGRSGGSFIDGIKGLQLETFQSELRNIREYGAVFMNRVGGHTFLLKYSQFVHRKEPIFPSYRREDIRVRRFEGGSHFYAFVGDMQVRKGDTLKWNTLEAARKAAEAVLEE